MTFAVETLLAKPTTTAVRARYEGSNIGAWIGFKHVNYLVEEAVLEHFRCAGLPARILYEEFGVGVDVIELDTRILTAVHLDDAITAAVVPGTHDGSGLAFKVTLTVPRGDSDIKTVTAKVRVALRAEEDGGGPAASLPAGLERFIVARIGSSEPVAPVIEEQFVDLLEGSGTTLDPVLVRLAGTGNTFGWKRRIPYFYCHFNDRMQFSGYLRQMEEVVDLFLDDRGISIKTLLDDRNWIPAVPRSTIRMTGEARMEEPLYTLLTVTDIFKTFTYTSQMDCYVIRDGALIPTATGTITHGYAAIDDRETWRLVDFDERVLRALGRQ